MKKDLERWFTVVCVILVGVLLAMHHATQENLHQRIVALEAAYTQATLHVTTTALEVRVR